MVNVLVHSNLKRKEGNVTLQTKQSLAYLLPVGPTGPSHTCLVYQKGVALYIFTFQAVVSTFLPLFVIIFNKDFMDM